VREEQRPTEADAERTRVLPSSPTPVSLRPKGSLPGVVDLPRPETVLRRSELEHTRRSAISGLIFNTVGLFVWPFMAGDEFARTCFAIGLAIALLNNAWLLYVASSEERYRQGSLIAFFLIAAIPNAAILLYLGTFGPLLVMFAYNVYTTCLAYGRYVARVTLAASIAPPLVLGTAIAGGWLEDPGLITPSEVIGPGGMTVVIGLFTAFMVLIYQQGRRSRELMVASLVERDAAVRDASHREALFLEARQDLERALQAGGMGRFTDQVLGSFKLGAVLGRGGMGEVYDAVHVETGAPAAVKMLLPEVLGRPDYVRRFLREVRVAASLDSPNIVRVLEIGDESAPIPFLAMERLEGEDLAQLLRQRERMRPVGVVELVRQVGRGITEANAKGIVHRDLKPQNLFRTGSDRKPVWKILDFGISKLTQSGDTLTRGETIGTPHYMAPEQARGEPVDIRTDLYALGAIAYRALTGHQPFPGDETAVILVDVLGKMPPRPSSLIKLRSAVDDVLALALAKSPQQRFATPDEFADALEAAIEGRISASVRERAQRVYDQTRWE
jgi:serine/threonine-protein kinase